MSEAKSAKSEVELVAELRNLIKGDICSQFDPDYQREVRKVWNARLYEKKALLFVNVECQDDILETLKFCKKHKLPLCICNGGTSMFAQDDGAVVIKLEKMNDVTVNQESKIVSIDCGAKQGIVDKTTAKYGLVTTLGQASFVGATGSGLLLGMGLIGRSYGYAIDNLHAIEMITGSGKVVTASATQNQELFWAMKGFGPNFGIITKLHVNLHPMPAQIMAGTLHFAWENAANTLRNMRDFILEKNDKRLALYGLISSHERGKLLLFLRYVFNGDLSLGQTYLEEFCKQSSPHSWDVKPMAYSAFQTTVDHLHPFGNYYFDDMGGFPLSEMSNEVIDVLIDRYNALPSVEEMSGSVCYVLTTGGAYSEVPEHSSPFLYRAARFSKDHPLLIHCYCRRNLKETVYARYSNSVRPKWATGMEEIAVPEDNLRRLARFHITNVCSTPNAEFQSEAVAWLDETIKCLSPFKMKVDTEISEKLMERLRKVKTQYDPENFFKYNINISPE